MTQTYERLARRKRTELLKYLKPKTVLRHRGDHNDFFTRYQAATKLATRIGKAGIRKLAPHLDEYFMDTRMLKVAWDYLSLHGGETAGPDGETYASIPEDQVWKYLKSLNRDLVESKYRVHKDEEHVKAISKGAGRGKRYLVLQNIYHRIVQRAALEVLQPLLDVRFDDHSFGYRPRLCTMHAIATARAVFRQKRRPYWVIADIKDAFDNVPIPRLLQILGSYIPSPEFVRLVKTILSGSCRPGLRQGGSLSPILLNLFLHHLLDRPWRRKFPNVPLLRYADDILLMCRSRREAKNAFQFLQQTVQSAGMALKGEFADSLTDLDAGKHCEWLGFAIQSPKRNLHITLGETAFDGFKESIAELIANHVYPEEQIDELVSAWLGQFGPAYSRHTKQYVYNRMCQIAKQCSIAVFPDQDQFRSWWRAAKKRWIQIRDDALELT